MPRTVRWLRRRQRFGTSPWVWELSCQEGKGHSGNLLKPSEDLGPLPVTDIFTCNLPLVTSFVMEWRMATPCPINLLQRSAGWIECILVRPLWWTQIGAISLVTLVHWSLQDRLTVHTGPCTVVVKVNILKSHQKDNLATYSTEGSVYVEF